MWLDIECHFFCAWARLHAVLCEVEFGLIHIQYSYNLIQVSQRDNLIESVNWQLHVNGTYSTDLVFKAHVYGQLLFPD